MPVDDVPESPCIKVCTLDPQTKLCLGCLRSVDEITGWTEFSSQEKLEVINKIAERLSLLTNS